MRFVIAATAIALLAVLAACGDDDSAPSPSATIPSASPTSTAGSDLSGTPTDPPEPANLINQGPDVEFPDDIAMIIERGCWGCDGGPGDFLRVYRDPSGSIRMENLVEDLQSTLLRLDPSGNTYPAPITNFAMTDDASVIVVSFCLAGWCAYGLDGTAGPDDQGVAYRSLDGGITWNEIGRGGPVFRVEAVLADGRVLVANGAHDDLTVDYTTLPDNTPVSPPADGLYPIGAHDGFVWGTNDGRILRTDGSRVFTVPGNSYVREQWITGMLAGSKGDALISWPLPIPNPRPAGFVDKFALAQLEATVAEARISRQWEIDGYAWTIGAWYPKDDRAIVSVVPHIAESAYTSPYPAIIDFTSRTYNPIIEPFKSDVPGYSSLGRTAVHAVQTGPFARVVDTGSCLNIRTSTSSTAEVLTCAADGVLLRSNEETASTEDMEWLSVMTPGGMQGWAATQFLER